MMPTVDISTSINGAFREFIPVPCILTCGGQIAIHRNIMDNGAWTVTHVNTGLSLVNELWEEQALELALQLQVLDPAGLDFDAPSPEVVASTAYQQMRDIVKQFKKEQEGA
jgi:hypothetical protein